MEYFFYLNHENLESDLNTLILVVSNLIGKIPEDSKVRNELVKSLDLIIQALDNVKKHQAT